MDASALPIFADPAAISTPGAMPSPIGEATPPDASLFGALVAAVAKAEEQEPVTPKPEIATKPPADNQAAQFDTLPIVAPPFVVRQRLAQTEVQPSFPKLLVPGLERLQFDEQDPSTSETMSPPVLASEEPAAIAVKRAPVQQSENSIPPAENEEPPPEHRTQLERTSARGTIPNIPAHDPSEPRRTEPEESAGDMTPPAPSAEVRLPELPLIEQTAGIVWSAPDVQTDSSSVEVIDAPQPRESSGNALSHSLAPEPATRPNGTALHQPTQPTQPSADLGASTPSKNTNESDGNIADRKTSTDSKSLTSNTETLAPERSPQAPQSPDRPKAAEPLRPQPASERAVEPLPQFTNAAASAQPSPPSPTVDSVNLLPTSPNVSAVTDGSIDAPVKLALATHDGQQTAELQTLALHIAARSARGDSRFTIRLDPPELGRIEVDLSVTSHGHAQAVLAVEKPQTLDLLMRDAPSLERALKDAGLELGSNLSFSLKEEGRPHFASDDRYQPPARTVELVPAEAANAHPALNASLVEQLYGLRTARLDITV